LSYDNLFQLQATGYVRYGAKPIAGKAGDAVAAAERNFLALRGLPMQRETDIRMINVYQDLPRSVATNPGNGGADWVVRCTGATTNTGTANVNCANASLDAMLAAAGSNDVLLVGGGAASNLATRPLENGRPTLRLGVGTQLATSGNAPTLATQFGSANLTPIFGTTVGAQPSFSNGVISIGSNTTISGFNFSNVSITNYSTSNVLISGNNFTGSYTDNPTDLTTAQAFGAINVSPNALPAIQLQNVDNLVISDNTFIYPQVQTYQSQNGSLPTGTAPVCNQNSYDQRNNGAPFGTPGNMSGLCLSGNAIRLNNISNATISSNTVVGALDEAFRINNPSGQIIIDSNTTSQMRMGPDSNIGTAIIIGQNRGTSNVTITNNTAFDNSPGVYPIIDATALDAQGRGAVAVIAAGSPNRLKKNAIDPIEIGLCRGTQSYGSVWDLYASADFSGNCSAATTMNLTIANNTIRLNAIPGNVVNQDGDGIDLNIGANAILHALIINNNVMALGLPRTKNIGDNGLTFDFRDNSSVNIAIQGNTINNSGDAAIGFSLQNTSLINQPGATRITMSGNIFGADTPSSLEIDLINNVGLPLSQFYVNNTDQEINQTIEQKNFNSGYYPTLYYNSSTPWQP
jgi:hypothetical protein